jgi:hypothetical protein
MKYSALQDIKPRIRKTKAALFKEKKKKKKMLFTRRWYLNFRKDVLNWCIWCIALCGAENLEFRKVLLSGLCCLLRSTEH